VADLFATSTVKSSHTGVTHVNLNQRFQGLEVFSGHVTVSLDKNGRVVFASGSLVKNLDAGASGMADLGALGAVAAAADGLDLEEPSGLRVLSGGAASAEAVVSRGGISSAPIPAKLGWQPTDDGLRLAWQVTIDESTDIHLWNAAVDAKTGELLDAVDWTIQDDHEDLAATLTGGSLPTPPPVVPDARGFSLDPVIDGSSYRVFDLALESPNDGPRRLVANPADATVSPFGWHDTDGAPGPEFTITRGNNTHTFLEQDNDQLPDFGDTDGGPGLDFDFPADLTEHSQAFRDAVVTNLFFGCNTFHDLLALYGFDENADNFQGIDYSGGPFSNGDYVRCHVASGAGTNNANFSTPSTGGAPRMRMYLWPGNQFGSQNEVVVDGVGGFGAGWARFGPPAMNAGTGGAIFDAANGCVAADYAGAPAGDWIAIATGGNTGCQNIEKARAADAAGAKAIILSSGTSSTTILSSNSGGTQTASPAIAAVSVSTANGDAIRAALPATGTVRKNPNHPGIRDGDFENGIIFHEYGHGLSNRLTGGPGINCLSGSEQMGEGWSDYVANVSMLDPDLDDPQGPRGMGPYALFQANRQGNGIRPRPYSRGMTIQPATYDSIKTNAWLTGSLAAPHGVGHAWAAMLWDMTWDLVDKHGFSGNIYLPWDAGGNNRALQYMVDGLKLQGCGPTFVTGRAAIITAANVLAGGGPGEVEGDSCMLWASFSRRGVGYGAVGGGTSRDDGTEAFDTHPLCREDFTAAADAPYGSLNSVRAGTAVALKFRADDFDSVGEVLKPSGGIFSRKVDCTTLQVPSSGERITPRELPIATEAQGQTKLALLKGGQFRYRWQTEADWVGSCREFVLTRADGVQHRAFFSFT
jgi:hypothetical protein